MPNQEEINNQLQLLVAYRRTLAHYLKQQAILGSAYIPPGVSHGIDEARQSIARIKPLLRSWRVPVEDLPDDEEFGAPTFMPDAEKICSSIYRFRAECDHDVNELYKILGLRIKKIIKVSEAPFPDIVVEIYVELSLEELRDAMRKVEDGHVMVQTVAPRAIYTGERDYEL